MWDIIKMTTNWNSVDKRSFYIVVISKEIMVKYIDKIIIGGEKAKKNFEEVHKKNKKIDLRILPLLKKTDSCISLFQELKDDFLQNKLHNYHIDNAKEIIKQFNEEKKFLNELYNEIKPWDHDYEFHDEICAYLEWIDSLSDIEDYIENLRNRCNQGGIMVNNIGNVVGSVQIQQNVVGSSQNIGNNKKFDYEAASELVNSIDLKLEDIRAEFKDKSGELLDLNNSLREYLNQKNEKGIRDILKRMCKIAESIGCGLVANGITAIISRLL